MHNFKQLKVWQESIELANHVLLVTESFPKRQEFILVPQILRAANSVPSNIAEGCGRDSAKDSHRFLWISSGSLNELESQLIISRNANFINEEAYKVISERILMISKMIYSLKLKLKSKFKRKD